ncbi:hypothetical protein RRG08_055824 [Elysia crispata]|uniref:Uncharacterized protein n=1 Tax=Elysia crispata TaxID=231223 RepID=A0AAE1AXS9_9GAST|nr:hypothetical protein RRG08_055824 [Elysia crispata]
MGGLAGVSILLLFCRRFKILIYTAVTLCCVSTLLSAVTAVLTGTHVVHPLLSVSKCVFIRAQRMCRCVTRFERDGLLLEEVSKGDVAYLRMEGVSSCGDVQDVLPGLLSTMIGVYGVLVLLGVVAAVIAILVYRTERHRKFLLQNAGYEDTYSSPSNQASASSASSSSENFSEHHVMLPMSSSSGNTNNNNNSSSSAARQANSIRAANIYTNANATDDDLDDDNVMTTNNVVISSTNNVASTITTSTTTTTTNNNNINKNKVVTPELGSARVKKSSAGKEKMKLKGQQLSPTMTSTEEEGSSTPSDTLCSSADAPVGYIEACRMRRCHSFSQPRRRAASPASSSSSSASFRGPASPGGTKAGIGLTKPSGGRPDPPSKLREHRKKGRRAVTLHGLDREQLLLILSLQMRYLQESDQVAKGELEAHTLAGEKNLVEKDVEKRGLNPTLASIPTDALRTKSNEHLAQTSAVPTLEVYNAVDSPRVPGILKKPNADQSGVPNSPVVTNDNQCFINENNTLLNTAANARLFSNMSGAVRGKHYIGGFGSTPNLNKRSGGYDGIDNEIFKTSDQHMKQQQQQLLKQIQHQQQQEKENNLLPMFSSPQMVNQSFQQLQRRAMTPTPRQERQASSRPPEDNLMDTYLPASLVRSHTPQPYTPYQLRDGGVLFQYNGPRQGAQAPPQNASLLQPYLYQQLQQQNHDGLLHPISAQQQQQPENQAAILSKQLQQQQEQQSQQEQLRHQQLQLIQQQEQLLQKRQQQQLMLQQQQRQQQHQVAMMQQQQLEMLQQQWLQEHQLLTQRQQQQQQQQQHLPQPNQHQSSPNLPPPLLPAPLLPQPVHHPYQQQRKMSDVSQTASLTASSITTAADVDEADEELPTLITYDLRNVGTCGPIVYENVPMARSSLSQGSGSYRGSPSPSSSNTSSLARPPGIAGGQLLRSGEPASLAPITTSDSQTLVSSSEFQENASTNSAGISQSNNCQPISRQTSEISNASAGSENVVSITTSSESGSSPTKKLAGLFSRSKTPPAQKKQKKMSKKEKAALKQEVEAAANLAAAQAAAGAEAAAQASSSPAGGGGPQLKRTDSTASGGKTDRWQIVLENGKTQGGKTLWENVQRKVVSDPQTPDSTLDQHQKAARKFFAESPVQQLQQQQKQQQQQQQQKQQPQAQQQQNAAPVVLNGILKKSNAPSNAYTSTENPQQRTIRQTQTPVSTKSSNSYLPQPYPTHDLDPIPNPLFPDLNPPYPNPNPVYKDVSPNQHAFLPIANSSTDNYEAIAEVAAMYNKQPPPPPTAAQQALTPPSKPPRLYPYQGAHGASNPSMAMSSQNATEATNWQPQSLRPKSYITAVEPEIPPVGVGVSGESGPYRTDIPPQQTSRNLHPNDIYGDINGDVYNRSRRRSAPQGPIQQQLPLQVHRQQQQQQRNGRPVHTLGQPYPQRSAFHALSHAQHSGPSPSPSPSLSSTNEACDTDLDDLPPPTWQSRYLRSQSFSPPPYAPRSLHQSMDAINKRASVRSNSSSSSDQHNTSMTSSERSFSTVGGGGSVRVRNQMAQGQTFQGHTQDRLANVHNVNNNSNIKNNSVADRRFCLTQQRLQQQQSQHQEHQQQQQHQNRMQLNRHEPTLNHVLPDSSAQQHQGFEDQSQENDSDDSYMVMRRCQSVEEGPSRLRPGGQALTQVLGPGASLIPPSIEFGGDLSNFVGASSLNNLQSQNIHKPQSPRQSPNTRPRQQQHHQQQQQQPQRQQLQAQQQHETQLTGIPAYQNLKLGSHTPTPGSGHKDLTMAMQSATASHMQKHNGTVLQLSDSSDIDGEYSETVI